MSNFEKIHHAYQNYQATRTLKLGWVLVAIGLPAILFFISTDLNALELSISQSLSWRSIGAIPLIVFIPLALSRFKRNSKEIVPFHAIALGGIVVMISGLTFIIFDMDFESEQIDRKFGVISGYLLVIFGIFLLSGGTKKYFKFILGIPIGLLIIGFLNTQKMDSTDWGLMANIFIAALLAIILSQQQAKSEFREFELKEKLAINEDELRGHRNHLQQLVDERTEELRKTLDQADSMNNLKTIMLTNLTHELRTPAGSIRSLVDLLRVENSNPDILAYTDMLQESSNRLLRTIENTIRFSELKSGVIEPKIEQIDFHSLFKREFENHQTKLATKGLDIVLQETETPLHFNSDGQILRQVIHHLLDNAIKFTNDGKIEVTYGLSENLFQLSVKDTGCGISTQALEFITTPFRQESEGLNRNTGGAGLGLAMVKGYLDILGGKLHIQSKEGEGSNFTFEIPVIPITTNK